MFDLLSDPFETMDLLQGTLTGTQSTALTNLEAEAMVIRN